MAYMGNMEGHDTNNPSFNDNIFPSVAGVDDDLIPELPEPPILTPSNTQQLEEFGDSIQSLRDKIHASELNAQK